MPNITIYVSKELYFKLQKEADDSETNESKIIQEVLKKHYDIKE